MMTKMIFRAGVRLMRLLVALLLLSSCQGEDDATGEYLHPVFIPSIGVYDSEATSRAYNNTWESGDRVGIYMIDGTISTNLSVDSRNAALVYKNVQYQAAAGTSVALTAVGTAITFPSSGSAVKFVAYSPYNSSIANAAAPTYSVNVTTQTTQKNIDLIHHLGTTNYTKANASVGLAFAHKLSKIIITIAKDPTSADFTPSSTTYSCNLVGFPRQASFNLATGALSSLSSTSTASSQLNPRFDSSGSTASSLSFEGILVPHTGSTYTTRSFTITIGSTTFTYSFPTSHNFTAGQRYTYNFSLQGAQLVLTGNTITNWTTGATYSVTITN